MCQNKLFEQKGQVFVLKRGNTVAKRFEEYTTHPDTGYLRM